MKVTDQGRGSFVITPENESLMDIGVAVIRSSYESARVFGMGGFRANETILTKEMALKMLEGEDVSKDYITNGNKPNNVCMDYVFGRCCKTNVEIDPLANVVRVRISERDRQPTKILSRAKELLTEGGK